MSTPTKVTVALNSMGQVAAASKPAAQSEITSGMVADLGQTLVELEVASSVADMDADKLFAYLAEHTATTVATRHSVHATTSQEITSGSL